MSLINPELDLVKLDGPEINLDTGGLDTQRIDIPDWTVPNFQNNTAKSANKPPEDSFDFFQDLLQKDTTPVENISRVNLDQAFRYNDKALGYQPGINNEEVYAQAKPFTWGDSFAKGGAIAKANLLSNYKNIISGFEKLSNGDTSGFYDNDYMEGLVGTLDEIEQEYAQYKTQDQIDHPWLNLNTTLKEIVPSAGFTVSAIADMLIGNLAIAGGSALVANAPGALAGTGIAATRFVKSAKGLSKAYNYMNKRSKELAKVYESGKKGLNQAKLLNDARVGTSAGKDVADFGRATLAGIFYSNAEAGMQAKMNRNHFVENQLADYKKQFGRDASGEDLKNIEQQADKLARSTYLLNTALIGTSNYVQFPALIRGKASQRYMDNIKFDKTASGLNAVVDKSKRSTVGRYLLDASAEGFEEFGQGVIDDATTIYYGSDIKENDNSLTSQLFKSVGNRMDSEGLMEFFSGFVIGGGFSLGPSVVNHITESREAERLAGAFNSETSKVLSDTIKKVEHYQNNNNSSSFVGQINATAAKDLELGTYEVTKDYIQTLSDLDINEFNEIMQLDFSTEQREELLIDVLDNYESALASNKLVKQALDIQDHVDKPWYKKAVNRLTKAFPDQPADRVQKKFWDDLQATVAIDFYNESVTQKRFEKVQAQMNTIVGNLNEKLLPGFKTLFTLNNSPEKSVQKWEKEMSTFKDIEGDAFIQSQVNLFNEISGKDPKEKINRVLDYYGVPKELYQEFLRLQASLSFRNDFSKPQELKARAQEIVNYLEYIGERQQAQTQAGTAEENVEKTETTPEEVTNVDGEAEKVVTKEELTLEDTKESGESSPSEMAKLVSDVEEPSPKKENLTTETVEDIFNKSESINTGESVPSSEFADNTTEGPTQNIVDQINNEIDNSRVDLTPKVTVASEGKIFKATGNTYFKEYETVNGDASIKNWVTGTKKGWTKGKAPIPTTKGRITEVDYSEVPAEALNLLDIPADSIIKNKIKKEKTEEVNKEAEKIELTDIERFSQENNNISVELLKTLSDKGFIKITC